KLRRELTDVEKTKVQGLSKAKQRQRQENLQRLRTLIRQHPCQQCPERESHARWGERYWQLKRKTDKLRRQIESRTSQVVRVFDRVNHVLEGLGYLSYDADGTLITTEHSNILKNIYGERDLLVSECL